MGDLIIKLIEAVLRLLGEIAVLALTIATVIALMAENFDKCIVYTLMIVAIQLSKIAENTRPNDEV